MKKGVIIILLFVVTSLTFISAFTNLLFGEEALECTDSDYGIDDEIYGYVSYGPNGPPAIQDFCQEEYLVFENYCKDGSYANVLVDCPNGCLNGRCISLGCTDSDGGIITTTRGKVEYYIEEGLDRGLKSLNDECEGNYLLEGQCNGLEGNTTRILCENGCYEGVCIDNNGQAEVEVGISECNVTNGMLNAEYFNGTQIILEETSCLDDKKIGKYSCSDNGIDITLTECVNSCNNAKCELIECSDTDGGKNLYVNGNVRNGNNELLVDNCLSGEILEEFFCGEIENPLYLNKANQSYYLCTNGCSEGVCNCSTNSNCPSGYNCVNQTCESCKTKWECGEWGACLDENQIRICIDKNGCRTNEEKPSIIRSCDSVCREDWECNDWSSCDNGIEIRDCKDDNNCGTKRTKPNTERECGLTEEELIAMQGGLTTLSSEELSATIENKPAIFSKDRYGRGVLNVGGKEVFVYLSLEEKNNLLYYDGDLESVEISVAPDSAIRISEKIQEVNKIILKAEEDRPIYIITGENKIRVMGVFPNTADIQIKIDAETGEIISIARPWWHIFASGI